MRIQTIDRSGNDVVIDNFPDERGEIFREFISDISPRLGFRATDMEPISFLVGQLAFLETEARNVEYEPRKFRQLLDNGCVTNEAGPWADTVVHRIKDRTGKGKRVNGSASNIPMANVAIAQGSVSVAEGAIGYSYSLKQLRAAAHTGSPLPADDQAAAIEGAEDHLDDVALLGEAESNFQGLLNHSSVDANTRASGAAWTSATTAEVILGDINVLLGNIYTKSKTRYPASRLVLPPSRFSLLTVPRSTNSDMTVLEFLRTRSIYSSMTGKPLEIVAGNTAMETLGGSGTRRAMAYTPNPQNVKFHTPMEQTFTPPQMEALMVVVYSEYSYGGIDFCKPYTAEYMDGI